jgi:hypothetical protein
LTGSSSSGTFDPLRRSSFSAIRILLLIAGMLGVFVGTQAHADLSICAETAEFSSIGQPDLHVLPQVQDLAPQADGEVCDATLDNSSDPEGADEVDHVRAGFDAVPPRSIGFWAPPGSLHPYGARQGANRVRGPPTGR